ncbi:MAG: Chromosomal replication initiator protein DnaA [Elusimicrobia bacterium]|nr:Chromosomal replication initiator protein DnaA [Elusimicrobiota bacterium]
MAKIDAASGLKPLYSFDQLVVGVHNHVAVAACLEVIKAPGETYNPLFVYGPPGVGKTHMMQAVAHQLLLTNPKFQVKYISAERFMNEILTAISEDRMLDVRRQYSTLDLLIIDDVQYMTESKISQEELFHIFNNLHHANCQVILAADRPPNQLTTLNKNIRSRLEWGLSTDIKIPDEATRIEILKKKQSLNPGVQMTEEMNAFVARNLKTNVRELEGFLKRIHAYVTLSRQTLNMDLVKSVVKEILPEGTPMEMEASAPVAVMPPPPPPAPPPSPVIEKATPVPPPPPVVEKKEANLPFNLLLDTIEDQDLTIPKTAPKIPAPPLPVIPLSPVFEKKIAPPPQPSPPPPVLPPSPPPTAPPPPVAPMPVPTASHAAVPPPSTVVSGNAVPSPMPVEMPTENNDLDSQDAEAMAGVKEICTVFFYPEGAEKELNTVIAKFQDVIKKHKLKFRLKSMHNQPYTYKGKVNVTAFVDVCKANKVPVAIVIGPPLGNMVSQQDFADQLNVTLDVQGISVQLIHWTEISKDYRYLNLSLDIALVRTR